ncbi:MAG: YggT family protein [Anaerolineae bacterium]
MFLFTIIRYILLIFNFLLFARALLSWFPDIDRSNQLVRMLYEVTEPILAPVRRLLPPTMGMDLSPLIVFAIIYVLLQVLP